MLKFISLGMKEKNQMKAKKNSYRSQVQLRDKNRANYGMPTKKAEAYQFIHDQLILLERREKLTAKPEKIIDEYFYMFNALVSKDEGKNYSVLEINIFFEKPLDDLTSLLTGKRVLSNSKKEALEACYKEVSKYIPIRRSIVKTEVAKSRTQSKKKAVTKKKATAKKKIEVAEVSTGKRGRKAAPIVNYWGEEVETDVAEEYLFSQDGEKDLESFENALKKGKVKPSEVIGYKNVPSNPFATVINAIGGNRGKSVPAKTAIQFLIDNLGLSERVARNRLYTLLDNQQLDIV